MTVAGRVAQEGSAGYDLVVIGAGPAGSATALRWLQHRRSGSAPRVLLADAAGSLENFRIGESIPPTTGRLLDALGVLPEFLAQNHDRCLGSSSAWGRRDLGYNDFLTQPEGFGWHLDRARFDELLARSAEARGAEFQRGWRLDGVGPRRTGGYRLTFQSPVGERTVQAAQVVDATGQRAAFARRVGSVRHFTDRLVCLANRFTPAPGAFDKLTLLEARSYGWWYAARLGNGQAVVALTTDSDTCRQRSLREPALWLAHLAQTEHLGPRLDGGTFDASALNLHPASSFRLDPVCGSDWLAVGDAASSYDPLASHGIYKALASGLRAGDVLAARSNGTLPDLTFYGEGFARSYDEFLALRSQLYAQEQRWAEAPFWQKRHAA